MGVGCGYVVPSAGLVRNQGLAVSGCGSGLICAWVLARLGGCDGSLLGFGAFGRSGARCRVRWRPSASGSFGDFWAGPGVAPRGGTLLGNGVRWRRRWPGGQARRVVWCAGLLGGVGVAVVGAPTLVGWLGGVFVRGWALADVPQADAVSLRLLEGLPQAPEDIRVVLGRGEVAGLDSQGVERIGQHGFPCSLRHPPPCQPAPRAHFRSSQSCVWVQRCHHCSCAGLRSWAEEWAWLGVTGSWGPVAVAGLEDSS